MANGSLILVLHALSLNPNEGGDDDNASDNETCTTAHDCIKGILLGVWHPHVKELNASDKAGRAIVYLLVLSYVLFGVNIITERMLSCIEVIIAQKRKVTIREKTAGEIHTIEVPIWHPVVATLTIHIIGASSAELFLPVIEIASNGFVAREFAWSLIFGSAAYRLFITTGLCILTVKDAISKPIQDLRVFFVTTAFAIFAYIWIFLLVYVITPGEITLWESMITIFYFPLLVFVAWFVEKRLDLTIKRKLLQFIGTIRPASSTGEAIAEVANGQLQELEKRRRTAELLRKLKLDHPGKSRLELEEMAQLQLLESLPKDAAFYRIQASKSISGGGDLISKEKIKKRLEHERMLTDHGPGTKTQFVGFEQTQMTCLESCGSVILTVLRYGSDVDDTILAVDFETVQATALAGLDFEHASGALQFSPGVVSSEVVINIIDDDEFEEDKDFKVLLKNPRLVIAQKETLPVNMEKMDLTKIIFANMEANIQILDDDHCGVFSFEAPYISLPDNIGIAKVKVVRSVGARGRVTIPFNVVEDSARKVDDFTLTSSQEITFEDNQPFAFIEFTVADRDRIGEVQKFAIGLDEPVILSRPPQNPNGNPRLGKQIKIDIHIGEDNELEQAIDRLLLLGGIANLIASTSWAEQIREAVKFEESSNQDQDINGVESELHLKMAKVRKYLLYGLSLPWKLLASLIPPARYLHGWLAFILLLGMMALLSVLIIDLASAFGCTIGLKDKVTAVTLVAFGLGMPDTYASRHAAVHEATADIAIGHITGSNAVNVFLGIGVAWLAAASYHSRDGETLALPHSGMGFIVVIYLALQTTAILALLLRRLPPVRGELGGPLAIKYASAMFFLILWMTFILLLILQSYCVIDSF